MKFAAFILILVSIPSAFALEEMKGECPESGGWKVLSIEPTGANAGINRCDLASHINQVLIRNSRSLQSCMEKALNNEEVIGRFDFQIAIQFQDNKVSLTDFKPFSHTRTRVLESAAPKFALDCKPIFYEDGAGPLPAEFTQELQACVSHQFERINFGQIPNSNFAYTMKFENQRDLRFAAEMTAWENRWHNCEP